MSTVTIQHGMKFPMLHRDPFDRLLIAQAIVEQLPVVASDAMLDRHGVNRVWN